MADRPATKLVSSCDVEILPPEKEEDRLAFILFKAMEHLDPSEQGDRGWDNLTEYERQYYFTCVRAILKAHNLPTTAW